MYIFYRWLVAAPSGADNVTNDLREVAQNTFFTGSNSITLDSIYFKAGSRISCAARAVTVDGDPGIESQSEAVTGTVLLSFQSEYLIFSIPYTHMQLI